jgi:hypothetical protein
VKVTTFDPPKPGVHIVQVIQFDLTLFAAEALTLSDRVTRKITAAGYLQEVTFGPVLSGGYNHLVWLSDGTIATSSRTGMIAFATDHGQRLPEGL